MGTPWKYPASIGRSAEGSFIDLKGILVQGFRMIYPRKKGIYPGRRALFEHVVKIPLHGFGVTRRAIVKADVFVQVEDIFLALVDDIPGFRQIGHDIKIRIQRHQGIVGIVRHPERLISGGSHAIELKASRMDVGSKGHPQGAAGFWCSRFTLSRQAVPRQGGKACYCCRSCEQRSPFHRRFLPRDRRHGEAGSGVHHSLLAFSLRWRLGTASSRISQYWSGMG